MDAIPERVQVAVRIRPIGPGARGNIAPIAVAGSSIRVDVAPIHAFTYDAVFSMECTQSHIYEQMVAPLVRIFLRGINATIFAYGQTGSGKTYTMGTGLETIFQADQMQEDGMVPRAIFEIFSLLGPDNPAATIYASFIEIYNEQIRDLLAPASTHLLIREDGNKEIYLAGCQEVHVQAPEELLHIVKRGTIARTTGSTDMNATSSRSHAILSVVLRKDGQISRFNFVDLAGSERLKRTNAVGTRAKEAISINSGLLALGNVISALAAGKQTHIPYRDSKLTRLLSSALGGNSCTLMIACIAPDEASLGESVNTLKYAARAKNIRNSAQVNEDASNLSGFEVAQLRKQIMNLKKENNELRAIIRRPEAAEDQFSIRESVEETIAAMKAAYEAKIHFLQERVAAQSGEQNLLGGALQIEHETGLSRTLRQKYELRIRELGRQVAALRQAQPQTAPQQNHTAELQLLSHQVATLRSTLQNTRTEKSRAHHQLAEEMNRLKQAYEQRENELRLLKISEKEHREEIQRLRKALDHSKSLVRKKNSTNITTNLRTPKVTTELVVRGGTPVRRSIQPLLPILSPDTLHKRSAFIIRADPTIPEEDQMDFSENLNYSESEEIPKMSSMGTMDFGVEPSKKNEELPTSLAPLSISSLFSRISAFTSRSSST